jgi:soluble lytic murein transglycosylase-like protein
MLKRGVVAAIAATGLALAPAAQAHLVMPGETLWGIAMANGLSTAALAAANGVSPEYHVIAGTTINVPAAGTTQTATASYTPPALGAYVVRPGDTMSGLAASSRIPLAQFTQMNGLDPAKPLLIGTVVKLPTGAPAPANAAQPAPAARVVPQAAPEPTPGRVTSSDIAVVANRNGVPASLASAIAWQESGFNNAMVSSANARGVMQVMPGTWDWVQANLAKRQLNPALAIDNVGAGVLYLGYLLRNTGGDVPTAVAGYYQGLDSVRRIGMLPETRQYVASVLALRPRFGG